MEKSLDPLDEVNAAYGIPGRLTFFRGKGALETVLLQTANGSCAEVCFFGAQLLSWQPAGSNRPLLFLSDDAIFDRRKAIRGGAPICWPQFGKFGALQQHGYARNAMWQLIHADGDCADGPMVVFRLPPSSASPAVSPASAAASSGASGAAGVDAAARSDRTDRGNAVAGAENGGGGDDKDDKQDDNSGSSAMQQLASSAAQCGELQAMIQLCTDGDVLVKLQALNDADAERIEFTAALHTYFCVPDVGAVRIDGLCGREYVDQADRDEVKRDHAECVTMDSETDRIYRNVPRTIRLYPGGSSGGVDGVITIHTSDNFTDTVVWNPWAEKAHELVDLGDSEWRSMVCIEPAVISQPVRLPPGGRWCAQARYAWTPSAERARSPQRDAAAVA